MKVPFLSHTKPGRYDRQEPLIGRSAQKRLGKSKIAIVGLGTLGSIIAEGAARSGIGQIVLIDRDIVEMENLSTQFLFWEKDVGMPKSGIARKRLSFINPDIKLISKTADVTPGTVDDAIGKKDLVIDATDNLAARFLINDYCRKKKIPWVHAAAIGERGTVCLFIQEKESACFSCIYHGKASADTCETAGIMGTTAAAVGGLALHLAIARLLGKKMPEQLLRLDLAALTLTPYAMKRRADCPVCSKKHFAYLEEKPATMKLCGASSFQITGKKKDLKKLKERLEHHGKVDDFTTFLRFKELTVFDDGRVLIKTSSKEEAETLYEKYIAS